MAEPRWCPACGIGPTACGLLQIQGERCCPACPTRDHPPRLPERTA